MPSRSEISLATEDKVKAFRSGGVDYVTKPFQFEEVQSRVETHLKLHRLQRALQQHNERLEELVQARTRDLAEAHTRLKILDKSKSDFLKLISHEFRTPLNGLLGVGELMVDELATELRDMYDESRRRILPILDQALLLTQIEVDPEKFAPIPISLARVISRATQQASEFAQSRAVTLEMESNKVAFVLGTGNLLVEAFQALLETTVKFSEPGETVRVSYHSVRDGMQVTIATRGRTIPVAALSKLFDVFSIGEAITPGGDLGLGPPLAYRILSLFGGSATAENGDPSGIQITVLLKCALIPSTNSQPEAVLSLA